MRVICPNGSGGKHLHIRGENIYKMVADKVIEETPPHTWRKSSSTTSVTPEQRNTSTYVEKMALVHLPWIQPKKHLHIRGENIGRYLNTNSAKETPPHTWRKFNRNTSRRTS